MSDPKYISQYSGNELTEAINVYLTATLNDINTVVRIKNKSAFDFNNLLAVLVHGKTSDIVTGTKSPDNPCTFNGTNCLHISGSKNMLQPIAGTATFGGVTCTIASDGTITLNGVSTVTDGRFKFTTALLSGAYTASWASDKALQIGTGKYTFSITSDKNIPTGASIGIRKINDTDICTLSNSTKDVTISTSDGYLSYIYIAFTASTVFNNYTFKLQFQVGENSTEWETYSGLQTIVLPKALYNISNTIGDKLDIITGAETIQTEIKKIDGTESWIEDTSVPSTQYIFAKYLCNFKAIGSCSHFDTVTVDDSWYTSQVEAIGLSNNYLCLKVLKTRAATLADLKTWLSNHNLSLIKQLDTDTILTEAVTPISQYGNMTQFITDNQSLIDSTLVYKKGHSYVVDTPYVHAPVSNVSPITFSYGTFGSNEYELYKLGKFAYARTRNTDKSWNSWSSPLSETKINRDSKPSTPSEGDVYLDISDQKYPKIQVYLNSTWVTINFDTNSSNVMKTNVYDKNSYRTDVFDKSSIKIMDEKLSASPDIDTKYAAEAHRLNKDLHVSADELSVYNSRLTTDQMTSGITAGNTSINNQTDSVFKSPTDANTAIKAEAQTAIDNINSHISNKVIHLSSAEKETFNSKAAGDHTHITDGKVKLDASDVSGQLSIDRIPPEALDRLYYVQDDTARLALTKTNVQNGDTVCVMNPSKSFWRVIDDTKLNSNDGYVNLTKYQLAADYATMTGTPTSIAGYGITDLFTKTDVTSNIQTDLTNLSKAYTDNKMGFTVSTNLKMDHILVKVKDTNKTLTFSGSSRTTILNLTSNDLDINNEHNFIYITPVPSDMSNLIFINNENATSSLPIIFFLENISKIILPISLLNVTTKEITTYILAINHPVIYR